MPNNATNSHSNSQHTEPSHKIVWQYVTDDGWTHQDANGKPCRDCADAFLHRALMRQADPQQFTDAKATLGPVDHKVHQKALDEVKYWKDELAKLTASFEQLRSAHLKATGYKSFRSCPATPQLKPASPDYEMADGTAVATKEIPLFALGNRSGTTAQAQSAGGEGVSPVLVPPDKEGTFGVDGSIYIKPKRIVSRITDEERADDEGVTGHNLQGRSRHFNRYIGFKPVRGITDTMRCATPFDQAADNCQRERIFACEDAAELFHRMWFEENPGSAEAYRVALTLTEVALKRDECKRSIVEKYLIQHFPKSADFYDHWVSAGMHSEVKQSAERAVEYFSLLTKHFPKDLPSPTAVEETEFLIDNPPGTPPPLHPDYLGHWFYHIRFHGSILPAFSPVPSSPGTQLQPTDDVLKPLSGVLRIASIMPRACWDEATRLALLVLRNGALDTLLIETLDVNNPVLNAVFPLTHREDLGPGMLVDFFKKLVVSQSQKDDISAWVKGNGDAGINLGDYSDDAVTMLD
ncbi:hypothetical protein EIP91_009542 [Steccherinum ochraceum]|uniref:Uncharacterized protein n=1 Tax=Steccherinum ochraceum TaxID=92696 RepID=A0A4R0R1I5_9APHY|nr:hypothetical protein EIP91_009542 [Steccherinum ochraceum]